MLLLPTEEQKMADDTDAQMAIQGRLWALEAMIAQAVWRWTMTQPHPPTALASWLRPIEEALATMQRDPGNHPAAMASAAETVKGTALLLERTLHEEALRRAEPSGSGHG
jgi:hypothetical protein